MAMGRPKAALVLSPEQREQLEGMANSRSLPAGLVNRVRIILLSARGKANRAIARQLDLSEATVGQWRRRFLAQGITGLHDELRSGRPRSIGDERVARLVRKTLETKPKDSTHWSVRQIARETRLSKSTVHRVWQVFGLEPHRQRHFKLSNDPFFVEKVRDIVGLYLDPPENAVVLCVDEKSQIQALKRTQPMLPMGQLKKSPISNCIVTPPATLHPEAIYVDLPMRTLVEKYQKSSTIEFSPIMELSGCRIRVFGETIAFIAVLESGEPSAPQNYSLQVQDYCS